MEQRIAKLERQCRWYRILFVLAGLIAVALVTWGATKPIPEVIRGRSLQIVDRNGNLIGKLGPTSLGQGGALTLFANVNGVQKEFVSLDASSIPTLGGFGSACTYRYEDSSDFLACLNGSSIQLTGSKGVKTNRMVLIESDENGGLIRLLNKTGENVVQLRADEYGNGVVGAYNRKGKGRTLKPGP